MQKKYRHDIQCLRAFAVIAVFLYHAVPTMVPGGFVGVDVFFVISGFLMTSIIVRGLNTNSFNFISFYGSRTRRIYPALILCVFIFFIIAFYSGLYSDSLDTLRRSARSAILGYSNIYFFNHTGYFDMASASQIFLHTWSLGIELQFYLIYPLILITCTRYLKMSINQTIIAMLVISFIASCYLVYSNQLAAFYLLPSRIWEFMAGGCLAIKKTGPTRQSHKNILLWSGLIIILLSSLVHSDTFAMYFPGAMALIPCTGAVLFLLGGQDACINSVPNKFILNPVFSFLGKLSYSFYLWHWPILVLYRLFVPSTAISLFGFILCFLLTLGFSYLSWRYIEEPVRYKFKKIGRYKQLAYFALSLMLFQLVYLQLKNPDYFYTERQLSYLQGAKDKSPYYDDEKNDILGDSSKEISFLLLGDSHALSISPCLTKIAKEKGVVGRYVRNGLILLNTNHGTTENNILTLQREKYEAVYIVARWSMHTNGPLPTEQQQGVAQANRFICSYSNQGYECRGEEALYRGLSDTIDYLLAQGTKKIYIVLPTPEHYYDIPKNAANLALFLSEDEINKKLSISYSEYQKRHKNTLNMLNQLAEHYDAVTLLDPVPLLKLDDGFMVVKDGKSLYLDDDHLSAYGSMFLAPLFQFDQ